MSTNPIPTAVIEAVAARPADGLPAGFVVNVVWTGVALDRPNTGGWFVVKRPLAERLARAIDAGVVHYGISVETDINGSTYVASSSRVLGRIMNADLRRLGY